MIIEARGRGQRAEGKRQVTNVNYSLRFALCPLPLID
jgi:hypothetical protein